MFRDKNGNFWYKVGLHIHTTISDGHVSPDEMARIYKSAGFDAVAVTDHWKFFGENEIEGLKIISGCEYNVGGGDTSDGVMHIVGVGMNEKPDVDKSATGQQIIDAINAAGGMSVLAHPAWSLNTKDDIKALSGFSMLEIYNTVSDAHESCRPYSGYIADVLANDKIFLPLIATDDAHYYDGTDETKSYIMVKADSGAQKDILSAIARHDFYATQGPELYVECSGNKINVQCSPCSTIRFLSNAAWTAGRIIRGENLTCAQYEPRNIEKWIRVEVIGMDGCSAWSNIIEL